MTNQYKNLTELLQLVPEDKKPVAKKITTELNFMSSTLTQLRKLVKEQGPVVLFKNGRQEMLVENPALKSYNTTVQRYNQLFKQLVDLLPKEDRKPEGGNPIYDFINGE